MDRARHKEGFGGGNRQSTVLTLSVLPVRSPFLSLLRAHPGHYVEFIRNGGVRRGTRGHVHSLDLFQSLLLGRPRSPPPPKKVTFLFLTVDSITDARSGDISCLPRWHLFPVSFVAL